MTIIVRRQHPPEIRNCRGRHCGVAIEWVQTVTGRRMPVSAPLQVVEELADGWTRIEAEQSHFVTCPDAGNFRHGSL